LHESLQKWRQIEHCIYELRTIKNVSTDIDEFERKCNNYFNDFMSYLDSNLNTSSAISAFMKLVSYVNNLSSSEKLTTAMSDIALPIVNTIMNIMGVKIAEIDIDTKKEIEKMIDQRNKLRAEKMFKDADNLRNKIFELYDVELTDHIMYTSWKKKQIIEFDRQ
jgi:cysteinyl-tRNA synthetase